MHEMHESFHPALLIPLAGMAVPLILVPTIIAMKQAQRKREWEHLERMKALELGRPLPCTQVWPALAAIFIGAIMPIGVFVVSWLALTKSSGFGFEAATVVGICGVWVGGSLGKRLFAEKTNRSVAEKFQGDPDAFDVVGRRG